MSNEDLELLKEFAIESQEHLADIETQLLTLESQGDNMDVALVNTVFRAIHSIKGAAGFMGLDTLGGLAHRAEEVLNRLRNKDLRPTSLVINTLLRATDRLKELIDNIEYSNDEDVAAHLVALEQILNGGAEGESDVTPNVAAPQKATEPTNVRPSAAPQGISPEALHEFLVESFDNVEQVERDLLSLERQPSSEAVLNSVFRSVHTIKGSAGFLGYTKLEKVTHVAENLLGSVRAGSLAFDSNVSERLLSTIDAIRGILKSIETEGTEGNDDFAQLIAELEEVQAASVTENGKAKRKSRGKAGNSASTVKGKQKSTPEISSASGDSTSAKSMPVAPASTANSANVELASSADASAVVRPANANPASSANDCPASESTIRVDVALLDKLMTCVGELVLARNQLLQYTNVISDPGLHRTSQRLNLITTELQEGVMKTRMQPIGNVWSKFPRLVRDLAAICEKQVRIEMEGKETELDKTIIEAIKDPLTHLVRNTVDHGIERPEVRLQNGKMAEGCLTLKAYHEGGQVNIEIVDDGAGLNLERIKNKAVERGLMTSEQVARMADRDVGNLIFLPGFSTAEKVSNVSGRGVGMDVVKTNIEKIGGTVDLQSTQGLGTTIKIKIPLTLAIIPALIVTSDGNRYAIPQVNLLELLRLDSDDRRQIEWIQDAPVYRLRGQLLPLVYLRNELGIPPREASEDLPTNIVVLRADDQLFGLVVDQINDSEEIVVKPLSKQLKGIPVYSGTTIMGDGRVALILDVMGLAVSSNVITPDRERSSAEVTASGVNRSGKTETLLVFRVGHSKRCALSLDQVTRLENLYATTTETAGSQEVIQYRGEILPLIRLSELMGVQAAPEDDSVIEVVVYSEGARSVGLVVDQIIEIIDADLSTLRTANGSNFYVPGNRGSFIIQDHVTDLVDLREIALSVNPAFFDSPQLTSCLDGCR
jgi:two-component system, chemotaxis family, sensor kinase CheA